MLLRTHVIASSCGLRRLSHRLLFTRALSNVSSPLDPSIQEEVLSTCATLHSSLLPLNAKVSIQQDELLPAAIPSGDGRIIPDTINISQLRGPLGSSATTASDGSDTTSLPFVLLVGNHSSGKSSFINHVLGRTVQTAGVAPTDDSFQGYDLDVDRGDADEHGVVRVGPVKHRGCA